MLCAVVKLSVVSEEPGRGFPSDSDRILARVGGRVRKKNDVELDPSRFEFNLSVKKRDPFTRSAGEGRDRMPGSVWAMRIPTTGRAGGVSARRRGGRAHQPKGQRGRCHRMAGTWTRYRTEHLFREGLLRNRMQVITNRRLLNVSKPSPSDSWNYPKIPHVTGVLRFLISTRSTPTFHPTPLLPSLRHVQIPLQVPKGAMTPHNRPPSEY